MNRMTRIFCGLAGISVLAVNAETFTISNGASAWDDPASYGETTKAPGVGDVVVVSDGFEVYINSKAQADYVSQFERIKPEAETSRIVVTVPDGEIWSITCGVSSVDCAAAGVKDFVNGELVKRGLGTLTIGGGNKLPASNSAVTLYDCWTGLTVEQGELQLPQNVTANANYYCGYVTISNGATFRTAQRASGVTANFAPTYLRGLFGEGTIVNEDARNLTLMGQNTQRTTEFYGKFSGNATVNFINTGTNLLWGVESDSTGTMVSGSATLGVYKFGNKADACSSIGGENVRIQMSDQAAPYAKILYLGEREETDRNIYVVQAPGNVKNGSHPAIVDGGVYGGLTFTADSTFTLGATTSANYEEKISRHFILTGDHQNECVLANLIYGNYVSGNSVYDGLYYVKEGVGTWRFADHRHRYYLASGMAVREGTLKFDSLWERGALSAIGVSTNLTDGSGLAYVPQVDYAFKLGPTNGVARAPAALEYSGTNGFVCATRPIALVGDGTLRNNTARRIRFAGVSALADGPALKTFTLDGDGVNLNEVADITDGAGKVGVTKIGAGTWVLSGDQTFSGPLEVKEGTLIARQTRPGNFTWFRWTIRQVRDSEKFCINSFGVFDADGKALMPKETTYNRFVAELEPGQVGVQAVYDLEYAVQSETMTGEIQKLFSCDNDYGWQGYVWASGVRVTTSANDPSTWIPVVMRVGEGSNAAASYDFANTWNGTNSNKKYDVDKYTLEGSVDGLHWTMLTNAPSTEASAASWQWAIARRNPNSNDKNGVHVDGAPIVGTTAQTYSLLESVEYVSVAPGATLATEDAVTISKLVLDGENGMGTIDGFAFAANGTIDVTGDKAKFLVQAPAQFRNTDTFGAINGWTVQVNGNASNYKVLASSGGIAIVKPGMALLFR